MALVYNGNTVLSIIFNGQTVKRAEFNGKVVFTSEITVTVTLNTYNWNNVVTATISDPQVLGDNDTVKVIVVRLANDGTPPPTEISLTKTNSTVTRSASEYAFYHECKVYNASGNLIGEKTFSSEDLTATFTGSLYD